MKRKARGALGSGLGPGRTCAASLILLFLCGSSGAFAQQPTTKDQPEVTPGRQSTVQASVDQRVASLAECVAMADRNYPKVDEARADLKRVRAKLSEVISMPFMAIRGRAGVSWPPVLNGTNIYSPDNDLTLSDEGRLGWQVSVQGTVPLWTFGKISNANDAAEAAVDLSQEELRKIRNEVTVAVFEAYYGLKLAQDALALVEDALSRLEGHEQTLAEQVDEGDADESSLYKLRLQLTELRARRSQAQSQRRVAQAGLTFLVGARQPVEVGDAPLSPLPQSLQGLEHYQRTALDQRPELGMAQAGVAARSAQVELERAKLYPDIGVTLGIDWSYAPGITDQRNPFVRDAANYRRYPLALGLSWNMDFLPQLARIEQAEAQLDEVQATARYARGGVAVEVETALSNATHAANELELAEEAEQIARRWMVTTQQGIELGLFPTKDLMEPAKEYALKRFAHIKAIFDYNLALAKLHLATGDMVTILNRSGR